MKIVAISDTHNKHNELTLPKGDVLVVAGDMTMMGRMEEVVDFSHWLHRQEFPHKIVIAGNHDFLFERNRKLGEDILASPGVHYLQDSSVVIDGVKFYGSPWQPRFFDWAFNVDRGKLHEKWDRIPEDTDVLITHGPAHGFLDQVSKLKHRDEHLGDKELMAAIDRVHPKVHICGHIHGGYGHTTIATISGPIKMYNAAVVDESYRMRNEPWEIKI